MTDNTPATPGTLNDEALEDLITLQGFIEDRYETLQRLIGRRLGRSQLRDELIRMVVIDFGRGVQRNMAAYQRLCLHLGSVSATRGELHLLADVRLFALVVLPDNRRSTLVLPTQRLIDWYSEQMPGLLEQVQLVVGRRGFSIVRND